MKLRRTPSPRPVDPQLWTAVDRYITATVVRPDPALQRALTASDKAGLPRISVSPNQGRLLEILARAVRAERILEIGTLGGYGTIWLAKALPARGRLITLEINPDFARVAGKNIERAGLGQKVKIMVGPALETLPRLRPAQRFDLVFIDADKSNIPSYFGWALKLTHPGSLIVVDNVIRKGAVIEPGNPDPAVKGVRTFNKSLARNPHIIATELQTVGIKGYDGFAVALVRSQGCGITVAQTQALSSSDTG